MKNSEIKEFIFVIASFAFFYFIRMKEKKSKKNNNKNEIIIKREKILSSIFRKIMSHIFIRDKIKNASIFKNIMSKFLIL